MAAGGLGCSSSTPAAPSVDAAVAGDLGADTGGPRCAQAEGAVSRRTDTLLAGATRASVSLVDPGACLRVYQLSTTEGLRDGVPGNPRAVHERAGWPRLRSQNDLFDALYAMALEEVRENAVGAIRDGAFNEGQPLTCPPEGCFETGRLWNYVWTRDTAYSVSLGLASADPLRARNSLLFKLSSRRGGGDTQIVQDTGTGGSYPVSTDRVVWALGASELVKWLDGEARARFVAQALEALKNTAEHDRAVIYDPVGGLYRGEQSFLDWREQSYAGYTAQNNVHIAMSRALSTNVLHAMALDTLISLAGLSGDAAAVARYTPWRDALKTAIARRFWHEPDQQFGAFVSTELDPVAVRRWDALGTSLAVLSGVASPAQARAAVAAYPRVGDVGPSVIWPQQQLTPIYHNRAVWPFVTAYALRAARQVGNGAAIERDVWAMMRGAATNLSNMENFEFPSGRNRLEDGPYTGPVVNSQRQLWSVAGYLSMVQDVIFGAETTLDGIRFHPAITATMRRGLFGNADRIVLDGLLYRGRTLTVRVRLPAVEADSTALLSVGAVTLNGAPVPADAWLTPAMLASGGDIEVTLGPPTAPATRVTVVDGADWRALFGPRTPRITALGPTADGQRLALRVETAEEDPSALRFDVFMQNERVLTNVPLGDGALVDPQSGDHTTRARCYTVEAVFASTGTRSQRSEPVCDWGPGGERVTTFGAASLRNTGGSLVMSPRPHYEAWGDPGHTLSVEYEARRTGEHLVQALAANGAGGFTTGITCSVQRVSVEDLGAPGEGQTGYLVMPHTGDWQAYRDSSFVSVRLTAGRRYRITLGGDDPRAVNMSRFDHFAQYTGGTGGRGGAFNRVNIAALKVLSGLERP